MAALSELATCLSGATPAATQQRSARYGIKDTSGAATGHWEGVVGGEVEGMGDILMTLTTLFGEGG